MNDEKGTKGNATVNAALRPATRATRATACAIGNGRVGFGSTVALGRMEAGAVVVLALAFFCG